MKQVSSSYLHHTRNIESLVDKQDKRFHYIQHQNTVRYKLIARTLSLFGPFLHQNASWLTVGDMDGMEANYLRAHDQKATASDLTDALLQAAKKQGLIDEAIALNIEQAHLPDDSFDYVSCKEAYHHFPRAFLGLYEMIRMARKAVILIEPIDIVQRMPSVLWLKNLLDRFHPHLIDKIWRNRFSFEAVGNFVFKISERDIERIAMGMGLPMVAFKGINIHLSNGLEPGMDEEPYNTGLWRKLNRKLKIKDSLARLHLIPQNHLCCVVFKQRPDAETLQHMQRMGFRILNLPENPYLK